MARGIVAVAIPVATVLTPAGRYALRLWLYRMRRQGRFTKRVLVVVAVAASQDLHPHVGIRGQRAHRHRGVHDGGVLRGEPADTKPADLGLQTASVVWIDFDLYSPTVCVLDFLTDVVKDGSVLVFDDWYCFRSRPDPGPAEGLCRVAGIATRPSPSCPTGGSTGPSSRSTDEHLEEGPPWAARTSSRVAR